jgi:hypothetical protein
MTESESPVLLIKHALREVRTLQPLGYHLHENTY